MATNTGAQSWLERFLGLHAIERRTAEYHIEVVVYTPPPAREELERQLADVRRGLQDARITLEVTREQLGFYAGLRRDLGASTESLNSLGGAALDNMSWTREEIELLEKRESELLAELKQLSTSSAAEQTG